MTGTVPRILVAEDVGSVREEITRSLNGIGQIDQYGDVQSALIAIQRAREEGWEYDAAILDFRLPRFPGDIDTPVDHSLCDSVRSTTIVWHISSYFGEDADIEEHVRSRHSANQAPNMIKKEIGFTGKLKRQVNQALAARRIEAALAALKHGDLEYAYSRRFRPNSMTASDTILLEQLCGDVRASWHLLTPSLQNELQECLEITVGEDGKAISVYER